jgi:type IV secretory pathway VirB2 component (pilin)
MTLRRGYAVLLVALLVFLVSAACGAEPCMLPWGSPGAGQWGSFTEVQTTLTSVGTSLAILMMVLQGIKWMLSETPEEREDAKRGIIYIIIGLILLGSAYSFVYYLLC